MTRVLIVDDEPLARQRARDLIEATSGFEVADECANGSEAIEALRQGDCDLVLLDVRMPGLGGFEVIDEIGVDRMPPFIFMTAFNEHAVRAFDVRAVDYVEKPWAPERLARALRRARRVLRARLDAGEEPWRDGSLVLRAGSRRVIVDVDRIEWIEAAANYARVHADGFEYLTRETLASLIVRLPQGRFLRVHRSTIVALAAIREVASDGDGGLEVHLRGGVRLRCSRSYRQRVLDRFSDA